MSDVFDGIKAVIVDVLKVDEGEIKMETRFVEDLKADSMDLFFLIDGLTEKFGTPISDEDARSIRTVGDAVKFIEANKK